MGGRPRDPQKERRVTRCRGRVESESDVKVNSEIFQSAAQFGKQVGKESRGW